MRVLAAVPGPSRRRIGIMTPWRSGRAGPALALLLLLSQHGAWGGEARIVESHPVAHAVVDGRNAQYFVRFDGPVDHGGSRLFITRDGRVVEVLRPRLDAAPELLFASAPALPPGDYELRWSMR